MTQNVFLHYAGIDVSKDKLDIYLLPEKQHYQIHNTPRAVKALAKQMPVKTIVVLEASGGYERICAETLQLMDVTTAVVNPTLVYHYRKGNNQFAKTDKIDAYVLACYAQERGDQLRPLKISKRQRILMDLHAGIEQLKKSIRQTKNRLRTTQNKAVQCSFRRVIKSTEQQLLCLEKQMQELIEENKLSAKTCELIQTIPGVGLKTATTIIAALPEIGQLEDKALQRLVGVAPMANDSGKFQGKRFIQGGRQDVRNAIYMAALVASRHHQAIKIYYEKKLSEGKAKKAALVACMAKLLRMINSVVRNQQAFIMPAEQCA